MTFLTTSTDLTFVRHGETLANASGRYNSRTLNAFSLKGQAEVTALTRQLLAERKFDVILVSPSPRALRTIAPYLKASRQIAVIWPLLYECCTGRRPKNAHPTTFAFGPKIVLPKGVASSFRLEKGRDRYPVAGDYDSGLAQVESSVNEFRTRYRNLRVLLVGHSGQGGHLLHELTGHWIQVKNATEIHVRLP